MMNTINDEEFDIMASNVRESVHKGNVANSEDHPEPFTKIPKYDIPPKSGQLTEEQVQQFYNEGYTIVTDFFSPEDLEPCKQAVAAMVERLAQKLHKAGKIKKLYKEYGVFQRLTMLEAEFPGSNILLFKEGILPKAFMDLWSSEKLVNMAEQFLGPQVAGHPVWNLRVKTPKNNATTVPWHQDCAYFSKESYDHMVLTAWIPFLDTNEFNGGMQVMKNSHRLGRVARHTCCQDGFWYVMLEEDEMQKTLGVNCAEDTVMCDVPYGGFLLFNNMTAHRSLPNLSKDVRWSIDLRWQSPHENWGFYNIAKGVLFRDPDQPDLKPDWETFLKVNRKEIWQKMHFDKIVEAGELDTTVTGPWIGRWDIVNHNKHTQAFLANQKKDEDDTDK